MRFPGFKGIWEEYKLSDFLTRYSESNKDEEFSIDDILSLSSHHGIVNRKELLEDTYSKVNHLNYNKTRLNDFVYGKSISANYPFGLFKVNNFKDGLLSTLYFTFQVKKNIYPKFLDCYFNHPNRANNFLRKYVLVGDRYITADSNYLLSGEMSLPTQIEEQKKIADFLYLIDQKILTQSKILQHYQSLIQNLREAIFKQKISFKDSDGNAFPGWEICKLKDIAERVVRKNSDNNQNVLTISAQHGLISQLEFFNKSVSAKNVEGYYLLKNGDFAYNKSYSTGYPMGAIKRLSRYDEGIVSTLYICFRFNEKANRVFMEHYFESQIQNNELEKIAQEGARNHGLLNVGVGDFFNIEIKLPCIKEQVEISKLLSSLSMRTNIENEILEKLKTQKSYLLQNLFI